MPPGHYGNRLETDSPCACVCACYLGHLRAQVDLSQVNGLWQQVVEQMAEQHAVSESLGQIANLTPHAQR